MRALLGAALAVLLVVLVLAGCSPTPGTPVSPRFLGHELTLAPSSDPVVVFESGAISGKAGCQSIRGRYTIDGARLRTSRVTVTGPTGCRLAARRSLFVRVLSSPTLVVEEDDGSSLAVVSNAGRLSLSVGPVATSGVGGTTVWSFVSGADATGTFVDHPPQNLQLSVGTIGETQDTRIERTGSLHTFDGCTWIGTYRYTGNLALETMPTPGVDVQSCGATPAAASEARYRFATVLGAATSAWHSAHLLLLRGPSGTLLFRISTAN
jgi:META domain